MIGMKRRTLFGQENTPFAVIVVLNERLYLYF